MIKFKKDAYESLDTALDTWLGVAGDKVGYAVEVTPVEGDPFLAFVVSSAPQSWWDENNERFMPSRDEGDGETLASWPVLVQGYNNGSPEGDPFVSIVRKLTVI